MASLKDKEKFTMQTPLDCGELLISLSKETQASSLQLEGLRFALND